MNERASPCILSISMSKKVCIASIAISFKICMATTDCRWKYVVRLRFHALTAMVPPRILQGFVPRVPLLILPTLMLSPKTQKIRSTVGILPLCERLQAKPGLNEETENSINAAWLKKISSGKLFRLETPLILKANTSTPSLQLQKRFVTKVIKSSGVM